MQGPKAWRYEALSRDGNISNSQRRSAKSDSLDRLRGGNRRFWAWRCAEGFKEVEAFHPVYVCFLGSTLSCTSCRRVLWALKTLARGTRPCCKLQALRWYTVYPHLDQEASPDPTTGPMSFTVHLSIPVLWQFKQKLNSLTATQSCKPEVESQGARTGTRFGLINNTGKG